MDAMWSPQIAAQLRSRGHDVVAAAERAELRRQDDEVLFAFAVQESRAIFTDDVADFRRLNEAARRDRRQLALLILTREGSFSRNARNQIGHIVLALDAILSEDRDYPSAELWL